MGAEGPIVTPEHCGAQIARLTILKGLPEDVEEYFTALADIPDERFTSAVSHALKTRQWFPTPAELRADCDLVGKVVAFSPPPGQRFEAVVGGGYTATFRNPFSGQELTVKVDRIWKFDCEDCEDTGWRSRQCPSIACERRHPHSAHEWVERCACIDWNPTIRRRKEATAKYSQATEKVGA